MTLALSGLKVLDLSMNLPGPYMSWLLAVLGAEVIKVENPAGGDYARALHSAGGSSPFFASLNRNKKSISLNLKHAKGKEIFLEILKTYDIMIEGFRPGTMDKLGLGYEAIREHNPRVIYVSITGYGHDTHYKYRAGHDINYTALAGVLGMTGTKEGRLAIPGVQIADFVGGSMLGGMGLLAAVIQREHSGKGQFVDTAMLDGTIAAATMVFGGISAGLETSGPTKMMLNGRYPCYNIYECSEGRHMTLGALEFKFWEAFCRAVSREDLLNSHFGGEDVIQELVKIFASRSQKEWIEFFKDKDACCEPVLTLEEMAESPLARARKMVAKSSDDNIYLSSPLRLSESPGPAETPAPDLGADNNQVLGSLGYSEGEILHLSRDGVI
jgi:alpha-methylacyl-CoA racemase